MMWQDLTEEQKLTAIIEVAKQRDDLKQQLADYRNTIAQQAELLAAHKAEMQDWQRELLTTKQQLTEAQRDELLAACESLSVLYSDSNPPMLWAEVGVKQIQKTWQEFRAAIAKVKP